MRSWRVVVGVLLSICSAARGEDIASVLQRSQQQRLDRIEWVADAGSAAAQRVRRSFDALLAGTPPALPVELRIADGSAAWAEALRGDVVVASAALGDLSETERLFILAHELGHIALDHAAQRERLYLKWIPGEVRQEHTDAIAPLLGREASALAHRQEFEADAFAMRLLHDMGGGSRDDVVGMFRRAGMRADTATHPGTRRRIGALLEVDAEQRPLAFARRALVEAR